MSGGPFDSAFDMLPIIPPLKQADIPPNNVGLFEEVEGLRTQLADMLYVADAQRRQIDQLQRAWRGIRSPDINIELNEDLTSEWTIPTLLAALEALTEATVQIFPAHISVWNSGTSSYDWAEVQRNSGDTAFATFTGNRNSTNYNEARHFGLAGNLPCGTTPILVLMHFTMDADGEIQPFFEVPMQFDSAFTHRTAADGTGFVAGDREDRKKSEAQVKQATGTFEPDDEYGVENQVGTSHGWVETYQTGAGYDTTAKDFIIQFWDVEFDVMGRSISRSKTFETQMIDAEAC